LTEKINKDIIYLEACGISWYETEEEVTVFEK